MDESNTYVEMEVHKLTIAVSVDLLRESTS